MSDNHVPVDGYTLWSNFTPLGMVCELGATPRIWTFESLTEHMQQTLPHIPIDKVHIARNPILGGWSVFLHNDYAYVCHDFQRGIKDMLDLLRRNL